MSRKLSIETLAMIFFTVTLFLSIIGFAMTRPDGRAAYSVFAIKLDHEPDNYVVLENPDNYTLQAIMGHSETFYSHDKTNIDELNQANTARFGSKDFYYEYNGSYYNLGLVIGDPNVEYPVIYQVGMGVSAAAIAVLVILIFIRLDRRHQKTADNSKSM